MRIMIVDCVPVKLERTNRPIDFTRIYTTRPQKSFIAVNQSNRVQSAQADPIPDAELFGKLEDLLKNTLALLRRIPESTIRFTPIGGEEIDIKITLKVPIFPETQDQISAMVENLTKTEPPTHTLDPYEGIKK